MKPRIKEIKFQNFLWIDICQPDVANLDRIAQEYNLDYFQIRDSLEIGHLPKLEKQEKYHFLILRAFTADIDDRVNTISDLSNKIAFFYNQFKVITIHRSAFDFLENIGIEQECESSEKFLIYVLNQMLQTYDSPLKIFNDKNDEMEKVIFLKDNTKISLEDLYYFKTKARITKKLLQIVQSVVNEIEVKEEVKTALQDIKDKILSLILSYDEVIENSNNLLHTYLSVNAQKSNDVMKLLTIFSAFFLPLTFLAGIYGMNFENMPELKWLNGYYLTLAVMVIIAVTIFLWFKRRRIL
jgi:magnesium transporter